MKNQLTTFVVVWFFVCASSYQIFISPSGSSLNNGTRSSPLSSIADVQQIFRNTSLVKPSEVIFLSGTYRINTTIILDSAFSGSTWR
jgi:hypothetical protein